MQLSLTYFYSYQEQVSIMRWNDGNYWALKASTEKNHRTLFNFMKKWKVHIRYQAHFKAGPMALKL